MDYDYSKRGFLLPDGCKDLIDVSKQKMPITTKIAATASDFTVTARLPELGSGDLEIIVDGRSLRIVSKLPGSQDPFESVIVVAPSYDVADARATYFNGQLRIVVPKC
jgi:HSP20 family molecular chaperone IbpA